MSPDGKSCRQQVRVNNITRSYTDWRQDVERTPSPNPIDVKKKKYIYIFNESLNNASTP